ncbi:MAG TPA: hypothetical protein VMR86_11935 [Myxococcota bacterium]|nr:hypothetical protein [Myxococcota bacterium]
MRRIGLALIAALSFAVAPRARAEDLSKLDLSGDWYVLLHYKDASSEDKSITNFKDFGWSIQQDANGLQVEEFPYVMFDEGTEEIRRAAMRGHTPWQPEGTVLSVLKDHMDVSSRASRKKSLSGDMASGMKSGASGPGKAGTMNFSRDWQITWAPASLKIVVTDSLGGGNAMLGEMAEASVYDLQARPAPDELTGTWKEGDKSGTVRMIRAKEHRVVK